MKTYKLSKRLLPDKLLSSTSYMHHDTKGTCYLGQILTLEGIDAEGLRLPSETKEIIIPLTMQYRSRVIDSPTTIRILKAYGLEPKLRDLEVQAALADMNITVEWVEPEVELKPVQKMSRPKASALSTPKVKVPRFAK